MKKKLYPVVGETCEVNIYESSIKSERTYYLGHVEISEREGRYLRPRTTKQDAEIDALNVIVEIKSEAANGKK